jgi:hypothetical protein
MRQIAYVLAAAGLACAAPVISQQPIDLPFSETVIEQRKAKRMRHAVATGSLAKRYRSRGPQARPRKRSNRNTISKRVCRKHRRAA